eukprot:2272200-Rhodomonas_salina.1
MATLTSDHSTSAAEMLPITPVLPNNSRAISSPLLSSFLAHGEFPFCTRLCREDRGRSRGVWSRITPQDSDGSAGRWARRQGGRGNSAVADEARTAITTITARKS